MRVLDGRVLQIFLLLFPVVIRGGVMRNTRRGKIPSALRFLHGSDLVLQVSILTSEILDVVGVTPILPSHEGDVLTGFLQNLRSAALVSLYKTIGFEKLFS